MEIVSNTEAEKIRKERLEIANRRVRRYSKLRLYTALKQVGAWESLKLAMENAGVMDEFNYANELASDYPLFQSILQTMTVQLPDIDIDGILSSCEI